MYVKGNPKNCRLRVFDAHMSKQAATASEKIHYVPTYLQCRLLNRSDSFAIAFMINESIFVRKILGSENSKVR
jgi:hypothetical protein